MPDAARKAPVIGERIVVIGNTSSGKSTLAARLAEKLGGRHVELDALYWALPNWKEPERADFQARMREAIRNQTRWASSGNYFGGGAREILWPHADTLIWLDMPLRTVLPRVITRSWRRWRDHELLWGTNYEEGWRHLKLWNPSESLIAFAVRYDRQKRRAYAAEFDDPRWAHLAKYRLRSPRAAAAFLEAAEAPAVTGTIRG